MSHADDLVFTDPDVPYFTQTRNAIIHNLKFYGEGITRVDNLLGDYTREVMGKLRVDAAIKPVNVLTYLHKYTVKNIIFFTTGKQVMIIFFIMDVIFNHIL